MILERSYQKKSVIIVTEVNYDRTTDLRCDSNKYLDQKTRVFFFYSDCSFYNHKSGQVEKCQDYYMEFSSKSLGQKDFLPHFLDSFCSS